MKILWLLPLLLGFSVPAIAHNEANGGDAMHRIGIGGKLSPDVEEGEDSLGKKFNRNGGETEEEAECVGLFCE